MKKIAALILSLVCGVVLTGCETYDAHRTAGPASVDANEPGIQDMMFVREALEGSLHEIDMGRIGVERAENIHVKLLAQKIFDDHNRAYKQLRVVAEKEQITTPEATQSASNMEHLENLSGAEFDRAYLAHLMEAHRTDVKKFEAAARNVRNSEVRDFAARTLPVLQEHLRMAENISTMAGFSEDVNEPAGAERPEPDPFYQGDSKRRHQFDR